VKYDKSILFISQQLFPCVSTRLRRHERRHVGHGGTTAI